jgi:hypothetical protein
VLTDNGEDRHNRPIKYGLTAAENQRRLELYEQEAMARIQASKAQDALLLQIALALKQQGR